MQIFKNPPGAAVFSWLPLTNVPKTPRSAHDVSRHARAPRANYDDHRNDTHTAAVTKSEQWNTCKTQLLYLRTTYRQLQILCERRVCVCIYIERENAETVKWLTQCANFATILLFTILRKAYRYTVS